MIRPVHIANQLIGAGHPCFIIAEAGVNHNGHLEMAKELIVAAKDAGADAVKFQTFSPGSVITHDAPKAAYQQKTTRADESQFEMLEKLSLSYDDFRELKVLADEQGILFLSTPVAPEDIDFLVTLGVPALKVASMDIVNYPLLDHFGRQGLPVIVSCGMATLGEVERGLDRLRCAGCDEVVLLHCVTNYPIRDDEANLRVMDTLCQAFQVPVGFSDHTTGVAVPIAAVARGACVIEKHFTLDRKLAGPDHAASLDKDTFRDMVSCIRIAESALGEPVKRPLDIELANRAAMRRSLVAAENIPAGTILRPNHFKLKRPGTGLGAEYIDLFVGNTALRSVAKDQVISLDILLPTCRGKEHKTNRG